MGKQILFYMTREDEIDFLDYSRTTGDVVLVPGVAAKPLLEELEEYRYFFELQDREFGESCHLWNRSISPIPNVEYYSRDAYYYVCASESEVISVIRCKLLDKEISMGRLYIDDEMTNTSGRAARKSKVFLDWYFDLCRWLRKHYRVRIDDAYTSERVRALSDNGLRLTGHSF